MFVSLVSSFIEDFFLIPFQQKKEIKMGNTLIQLKYLLFCSSIDLFDVKGENLVAVFMVRATSLGNGSEW